MSQDGWISLRHKNVLTEASNIDAFEADSEGSANSDGPPTILSPQFKFTLEKMDKGEFLLRFMFPRESNDLLYRYRQRKRSSTGHQQ